MKKLLYVIGSLIICFSCEDIIDVDLKEAPEAYVVDAWIDNSDQMQTIRINKSQPYFESSIAPPVIGADVTVRDSNGNNISFIETSPGVYQWNPDTAAIAIAIVGTSYDLRIEVDGEVFLANSTLNRVPEIDSLKFTFKEEQSPFEPEGYYAEFVATDPLGPGDTYWIKTYKNGLLLNNPFDLNVAFDAGFSEGGNIDGVVFIQPIQDAVTPFNDDLDAIVPYEIGDSLYVEIHSITNKAFDFLQQVIVQTQRDGGFDEIFAEPLQNVSTNIQSINPNSEDQVIGFFNVAAISGRGKRLIE